MPKYYVTHTDEYGERHQIGDAFEADNAAQALATILTQSATADDGHYEVWWLEGPVT